MHVVDLSFSKSSKCFTRMKDGIRTISLCFHITKLKKIDEVKEFA